MVLFTNTFKLCFLPKFYINCKTSFFSFEYIVWIVSKVSPESIPEPLQPFAGPQPGQYPPNYPQQPIVSNPVPEVTVAPSANQA